MEVDEVALWETFEREHATGAFVTSVCGHCGHRHLIGTALCRYPIPCAGQLFDCLCAAFVPLAEVREKYAER